MQWTILCMCLHLSLYAKFLKAKFLSEIIWTFLTLFETLLNFFSRSFVQFECLFSDNEDSSYSFLYNNSQCVWNLAIYEELYWALCFLPFNSQKANGVSLLLLSLYRWKLKLREVEELIQRSMFTSGTVETLTRFI